MLRKHFKTFCVKQKGATRKSEKRVAITNGLAWAVARENEKWSERSTCLQMIFHWEIHANYGVVWNYFCKSRWQLTCFSCFYRRSPARLGRYSFICIPNPELSLKFTYKWVHSTKNHKGNDFEGHSKATKGSYSPRVALQEMWGFWQCHTDKKENQLNASYGTLITAHVDKIAVKLKGNQSEHS